MRSRSKRVADLASALFSEHALYQMSRRVLTIDQVRSVLATPEEVSLLREGRIVVHGFISMGEPARPICSESLWTWTQNRQLLSQSTRSVR